MNVSTHEMMSVYEQIDPKALRKIRRQRFFRKALKLIARIPRALQFALDHKEEIHAMLGVRYNDRVELALEYIVLIVALIKLKGGENGEL
jgi:hypothetical protein